ncbi:MAG: phosphoglycerate kinase [Bacilli bacterium]|nr:phosphoglycerate kinase [Bacilli bacterium]
MMKKTIRNLEISGKKVIIRCDFNVPIKDGKIIDDNRIKMSLETIKYAVDKGAKVILMSHLGRVKEEKDLKKNDLSLVGKRLANLLNKKITFVSKTRGTELEQAINKMINGDVLLVQNTRYEDLFMEKESSNDQELSSYWASLGDLFVNDAFGTIHRAHASNVGIASKLPNCIGFLVEKEFNSLSILNNPSKPFILILGGSKVSDKIGIIDNMIEKVDKIIIGGGMAFTFLKAKGLNIGTSIVDLDSIEYCSNLISKYPDKIILPIDFNFSTGMDETLPNRIDKIDNILDNEMGLDIGPETIKLFKENLGNAKTVLWNGPMGVYEIEKYSIGTRKILELLVLLDITCILGGGDIVAAASKFNLKDSVTHASTGGGATLEYLEGKKLPGLEIIGDLN